MFSEKKSVFLVKRLFSSFIQRGGGECCFVFFVFFIQFVLIEWILCLYSNRSQKDVNTEAASTFFLERSVGGE